MGLLGPCQFQSPENLGLSALANGEIMCNWGLPESVCSMGCGRKKISGWRNMYINLMCILRCTGFVHVYELTFLASETECVVQNEMQTFLNKLPV